MTKKPEVVVHNDESQVMEEKSVVEVQESEAMTTNEDISAEVVNVTSDD